MTDIEQIAYKMLLIRRVEEEIVNRYPKQLMRSPVHLSIGQEAISVGACHHLKKEDSVFSTHRCHAAYLSKGGDLNRMILELHGKIGGCTEGRGSSMHLMDKSVNVMSIPIVASAIPLAVGVALANKMDGNGNIVVCFFGDAAVEEGIFAESMNFASLMGLPIIFVCEDNSYSVDTHIKKRQAKRPLSFLAAAHGMNCEVLRNQNVFDIANCFKSIIDKKDYPMFIVAETQRSHQHCGVDKEFELENDPVQIAVEISKLHVKKLYAAEMDIKEKIKEVFDTAETAPLPTPNMAARYVYA